MRRAETKWGRGSGLKAGQLVKVETASDCVMYLIQVRKTCQTWRLKAAEVMSRGSQGQDLEVLNKQG